MLKEWRTYADHVPTGATYSTHPARDVDAGLKRGVGAGARGQPVFNIDFPTFLANPIVEVYCPYTGTKGCGANNNRSKVMPCRVDINYGYLTNKAVCIWANPRQDHKKPVWEDFSLPWRPLTDTIKPPNFRRQDAPGSHFLDIKWNVDYLWKWVPFGAGWYYLIDESNPTISPPITKPQSLSFDGITENKTQWEWSDPGIGYSTVIIHRASTKVYLNSRENFLGPHEVLLIHIVVRGEV